MRICGLNILLLAALGGLSTSGVCELRLWAADEVTARRNEVALEQPVPNPSWARAPGVTNSTSAALQPRFLPGVTNAFDREVAIALMNRLDPDVQRKLGLDPAQGVDTNQILAIRRAIEHYTNSIARNSGTKNTAGRNSAAPGPPRAEPSGVLSLLTEIERHRQEADEQARLYEQESPRLMKVIRMASSVSNWTALAAGLTLYLYISFCCRQLCWRTGTPTHVLVWLPRFKRLPLFQATGVSFLWFWLGFFIPFVGMCGWAICCWRLCCTFQKSKWLGLAMACPFVGWILLIYLAAATRAEDDEVSIKRLKAGYAF